MREAYGGSQALGDLIRSVRARMGLTQKEFAPMLGVTRSSVANIEAGRQEVAASRLLPLLLDLGVVVMAESTGPAVDSEGQRRQALAASVAAVDAAIGSLRATREWLDAL